MTQALVLGHRGMIGSQVLEQLDHRIVTFNLGTSKFSGEDGPTNLLKQISDLGLESGDYIVNCLGITKSMISGSDPRITLDAVRVNTEIPLRLATFAEATGCRVIHITTDCVFSGKKGRYVETECHDAFDVYGKSKSLGEAFSSAVLNLRTSVIGFEPRKNSMFLNWLMNLSPGEKIHGYENHLWSGVTSECLARIILGIVMDPDWRSGTQHLVPGDTATKYELVQLCLRRLGRLDVVVDRFNAEPVDRSLETLDEERNLHLFRNGGFAALPTISELVSTMDVPNRREAIDD